MAGSFLGAKIANIFDKLLHLACVYAILLRITHAGGSVACAGNGG